MNLKLLREKHKLSQEKAAKLINISQSNYSKYEQNKILPDILMLIQLANYYDVSLDYLCDRQWNNQVGYIPDDRREAVKQLIELNDRQFERIKYYIQACTDENKE